MVVPTVSPNKMMLAMLVVVVPGSDCRQETNRQIAPSAVELASNKQPAFATVVLGFTPPTGTDRMAPW